jgi:splicing factor 3B subunit 4
MRRTLFITNIPKKASRKIVHELLIQAARMSSLHCDPEKGYAFADYETEEELEYACNVLGETRLFGSRLYFRRVEDETEVMVRGLGPEIDEVFLYDVFSKFGSCNVELGDAVGVVRYKRRSSALRAVEVTNGRTIGHSEITTECRDREPEPHDKGIGSAKSQSNPHRAA